jgi:hypothetical protein
MQPGVVHLAVTPVETIDSAIRRSPACSQSIHESQMKVIGGGPLLRGTGAFVLGGHYFGAHSLHLSARALLMDYHFNREWTNISHYDTEISHYRVLEEIILRKKGNEAYSDGPVGQSLYGLIALVGMPSRVQVALHNCLPLLDHEQLSGDEEWLVGGYQPLQELRLEMCKRIHTLLGLLPEEDVLNAKEFSEQLYGQFTMDQLIASILVSVYLSVLLHSSHSHVIQRRLE